MYILLIALFNLSHSDGQVDPIPVNIVVIIDTSDRISEEKHPDQRKRDIFILEEIVDQFSELAQPIVSEGGTMETPHTLTFAVPPQPKTQKPADEIINRLAITTPKRRSENPEFLNKIGKLKDAISALYDHVQQHPQTGSDIWDWFRSKAAPSFSKGYQNRIICISDGYLNFDIDIEDERRKGSKRTYMRVGALRDDPEEAVNMIKNGNEGLSPVNNLADFNIKFLMLEIRLREENGVKHFEDYDIIKAYWKTWLNAMGIQETEFYEQLDPRALENVIRKCVAP